ncbi:hypothetical protein JM93_01704 [Roseibium hamelinense]|uniref:Uncharacterized protein n=1 Tax=Roseibium hamelinense TaxID=150831 RepID=A0A562T7D1_9HYPH|nr:hypothetical protein JM93_01704 [Roseibium hamelinense]
MIIYNQAIFYDVLGAIFKVRQSAGAYVSDKAGAFCTFIPANNLKPAHRLFFLPSAPIRTDITPDSKLAAGLWHKGIIAF